MKSCKKYNNIRIEMLRMKYELKAEYRKVLNYIRFFSLLKYNRMGIAS
jgi:hypothetical protein